MWYEIDKPIKIGPIISKNTPHNKPLYIYKLGGNIILIYVRVINS